MNPILSAPTALTASAIDAARRTIERSIRQAVPAIADFCLVHLASGRTIRCVAGAHSTRQGARTMRALMRTHRISPDDRDSTVAHVVRTRRTTLRTEIRPDTDGRPRRGSVAELHRRLAPTSALVVPIVHREVVLGALSLCYSHSGRTYSSRHAAAATRLASRIAAMLVPAAPGDMAVGPRGATRLTRPGPPVRRRAAAEK